MLTLLNLTLNKFERENLNQSSYTNLKSAWLEDSTISCAAFNATFNRPNWGKKPKTEQWKYGRSFMHTIKQISFEGFSGHVRFKTENERFVNTSLWQYKGPNNIHKLASWNEQSK